ncbi:MAG: ABC transporter permease [Anaerolineae bacterium]|nr:ABC transporter permease [Anaerolineae bacterium]MDW8171154.1 ABC transporter permease [Anaerolineae bacterium]
MNKLWTVFWYELTTQLKRRGYWVGTLGLPLSLFVFAFGYNFLAGAAAPDPQEVVRQFDFRGIQRAGIVDYSGAFRKVPESLASRITLYDDEQQARADVRSGKIDALYVVAEDWAETGDVRLHTPNVALDRITSAPLEQLFYETVVEDVEPRLLRRLSRPVNLELFNLSRTSRDGTQATNEDADFILVYVFTIVFLLGLFVSSGYLMQGVIEEKENKAIEVLISSVRPLELLGGKILAYGTQGLLAIVLWVGLGLLALNTAVQLPAFQTATALLNIQVPYERLPIMLAYFVLAYFTFAAIYGAIGALSSSLTDGSQYIFVFVLPSVIPLYLFGIFLQTPNATLPTILSILPLSGPISMLIRITIVEVPVLEIVLSLGMQVIGLIGAVWLAARLFRVQTLLSGQTPKWRDLPKLLRG